MFENFSLNPLETLPGTPIKNPLVSIYEWLTSKPETKDKAQEVHETAQGERQDIWASLFDSSTARYYPNLSKMQDLYKGFGVAKDLLKDDGRDMKTKLLDMAKDPEKMLQDLNSFLALSIFVPDSFLKPMTDWIKEQGVFKFLLNAYDSYLTPNVPLINEGNAKNHGTIFGTAAGAVAGRMIGGGMGSTALGAAAGGMIGSFAPDTMATLAPQEQNWKERIEKEDYKPQDVIDFLRIVTTDAHGLAALIQNMFSDKTAGTSAHFTIPGMTADNPVTRLLDRKPASPEGEHQQAA